MFGITSHAFVTADEENKRPVVRVYIKQWKNINSTLKHYTMMQRISCLSY